jgi:23S rRNA pseudouridine2605 synthase
MNHENFQPRRNSDASSGNGQRPPRQRFTLTNNDRERTSFNPNFYRENRTYKSSVRNENGENPFYNRENRTYNRENHGSNYNSERKPYRNYNSGNPEHSQRNYNNYNTSGERPQRSYNNYNSGERPQRNYNNYNNSERPQRNFNSGNNSERPQRGYNNYDSAERPQRSYNNYENRQNANNRYGNNRPSFNQNSGYRKPYGERFNKNENYKPDAKYSRKKQFEYKQQFVDYTKPMRLNKFLANSSTCSRREADEFIVAGVIKVNGEVVTELGTKIVPATDKVHFHDQLVALEKKVYVLLNKPKNCVTTSDDPQERLTVLDLVKGACNERIYPVGRLDRNTTGVILLTNDGDLTSKLTHPKYDKKKIYQITLDKDFEQEDMQKLLDGIVLEDGEMKADDMSYVKEDSLKDIGIEIHSGKNRIVRRMFEHLGYKIIRLDRVYFAGLTKKNLPRGKWRHLSEREVSMLKMTS